MFFVKLVLTISLFEFCKSEGNITKRSTDSIECGTPHGLGGFVFKGETVDRYEFPWKAALFRRSNGKKTYNCGGILLSAKNVVTAAHCIQNKNERSPALLRDLLIILGAFDFDDSLEEGRISTGVKKYQIHDNWNPSSQDFAGDVAILELINSVTFNEYVRPVCLPDETVTDISTGTLAGWGLYDNDHGVSNVPRKLDLTIVPDGECFRENLVLAVISSADTFCAGKKGSAVCQGDSGSGMCVVKNKKFYLRGIVSSSTVGRCSDGYLAIYSDIAKYLDFIRDFMYGGSSTTANLNCLDHGYAYCCVLNELAMRSANTQVNNLQTTHEAGKSNADVKFLHFWVRNIEHLVNFQDGLMAKTLPNLEAYVIEGFDRGNPSNVNNNINLKSNLRRENFRGFSNIKRLGINYCNVKSLNEDVFYELTALENLNLHSNNIRELPVKLLINNPKLNVLQAQNNAIESIPGELFDKNPQLWYVEFTNNNLKKIDVDFKKFKHLYMLALEKNICIDQKYEISKVSPSDLDRINEICK